MKCVGLISGGKDGIYNLIKCLEYGHEIICLANLYPDIKYDTDELNSHMFQTVGHEIIPAIAQACHLPLIRQAIGGKSLRTDFYYQQGPSQITSSGSQEHSSSSTTSQEQQQHVDDYDEIDDLYILLQRVKAAYPEVTAVACGAILSNYQRTRVERIASIFGLTVLAYLWQYDQKMLLQEMSQSFDFCPRFIKIATPGIDPNKYLTTSIIDAIPILHQLYNEYGMNVCGEGGEYESIVTDCVLFKEIIIVDEWKIIPINIQQDITVPYAIITKFHLEPKTEQRQQECLAFINNARKCVSMEPEFPYEISTIDITSDNTSDNTQKQASSILTTTTQLDNLIRNYKLMLARNTIPDAPHMVFRAFLRADDSTTLFTAVQTLQTRCINECQLQLIPIFVFLGIPDMKNFGPVNTQYLSFFPAIRPAARVCVEAPNRAFFIDVVFLRVEQQHQEQLTDDSHNIALLQQYMTSFHAAGLSTWAPANIGPYGQFWRLNGLYLGAGQIGMFPPTMGLYSTPYHQIIQTLRNASACLQTASDISSWNNSTAHAASLLTSSTGGGLQHQSYDTTSNPSLGQFSSLICTVQQHALLSCLDAIVPLSSNGAPISRIQQLSLWLLFLLQMTQISGVPIRTETALTSGQHFIQSAALLQLISTQRDRERYTQMQQIEDLVIASGALHTSPLRESWPSASRQQKLATIRVILHQMLTNRAYLPAIIKAYDTDDSLTVLRAPTVFSSIYERSDQEAIAATTPSVALDQDGEYDDDDDDDDADERFSIDRCNNAPGPIIFAPAAVLPRLAHFELASTALTSHVFKMTQQRDKNSMDADDLHLSLYDYQSLQEQTTRMNTFECPYTNTLSFNNVYIYRRIVPSEQNSISGANIFSVIYGIFIPGLFADLAIYDIACNLQNDQIIIDETVTIQHNMTQTLRNVLQECSLCFDDEDNTTTAPIDIVQDQLVSQFSQLSFEQQSQTELSCDTIATVLSPVTAMYFPSTPQFDQYNLAVAQLYTVGVFQGLFDNSPQLTALQAFVRRPTLQKMLTTQEKTIFQLSSQDLQDELESQDIPMRPPRYLSAVDTQGVDRICSAANIPAPIQYFVQTDVLSEQTSTFQYRLISIRHIVVSRLAELASTAQGK